jgi:hypothetical protein
MTAGKVQPPGQPHIVHSSSSMPYLLLWRLQTGLTTS